MMTFIHRCQRFYGEILMMIDVEIDGIDDLIKELENLERTTEEAKDDALISGGELLKNKIKSEVYSHGLHRRTGQAQDSIVRTDPKDRSEERRVGKGVEQGDGRMMIKKIGKTNKI